MYRISPLYIDAIENSRLFNYKIITIIIFFREQHRFLRFFEIIFHNYDQQINKTCFPYWRIRLDTWRVHYEKSYSKNDYYMNSIHTTVHDIILNKILIILRNGQKTWLKKIIDSYNYFNNNDIVINQFQLWLRFHLFELTVNEYFSFHWYISICDLLRKSETVIYCLCEFIHHVDNIA